MGKDPDEIMGGGSKEEQSQGSIICRIAVLIALPRYLATENEAGSAKSLIFVPSCCGDNINDKQMKLRDITPVMSGAYALPESFARLLGSTKWLCIGIKPRTSLLQRNLYPQKTSDVKVLA